MSKLTVTVTEQISNVAVTEQVIEVNEATGIGPQGIAGVISATAPVTYNSGTQTVGINAGVANGVATLDSDGKVPTTQLPPLAVNDTFVVASQAAMLALTAQVGDIAVRTDVTKTFILTASPASTLGNWQEILTPPGVTSITATSPLTGGTITSTGSIGLDQTALVLDTSQINWSAIAAWQPSTAYAKGALVEYQGIAYRRSVAGTSGTTFNSANWQQFTPTPTSSGAADSLVKTDSNGSTSFTTASALTFRYAATGPGSATLVKGGTSSTNESLVLPSTSGTLIGTGDVGTVTNTMLAGSIAQSKIVAPAATGYWVKSATYNVGDVVLYDYKTWRCIQGHTGRTTIPNNDTSYWQLQWKDQVFDYALPTVGSYMDPIPRHLAVVSRTLTNNNLFCTWFTATQTITITSMTAICNVAYVGGGTPVFQIGIFQPSDSSGNYSYGMSPIYSKCLARGTIANANLSTAGTVFTTTLDTSITLTAGTIYGVGMSAYASSGSFTTGAQVSAITNNGYGNMGPYVFSGGGTFGSSTMTVGTTYNTTGTGAGSAPWARLNA